MVKLLNYTAAQCDAASTTNRCGEDACPANAISSIWFALAIVAVAIFSSGCRNCGQQSCVPQQYTPYANPAYGYGFNNANSGVYAGGNGVAQARIAAPATYSLNIPGVNNNNVNANGLRVGQLPSGLLNTQQNAPTPANGSGNFNQQQGWRQSNGSDLNTTSSTQSTIGNSRFANASAATSVLERSPSSSNIPSSSSNSRTASLNNTVGNNVSFTQSNDYRTTSIDERRDNSRLPVTDATNVRATAPFAQNQSGSGQYVQPYYEPRQQNQQLNTAAAPPTYFQGAFTQPNANNFNNALPQTFQGSFGQRIASAAQSQGQVLAQSTTRYDPYQSSASSVTSDWRDRGRESQSY